MKYLIQAPLVILILLTSCTRMNISERPNILFIMTDDHGYQALSCYNGTLNITPNLDRIADEGIIFRNSFVTNSICAPSRAVMLTGRHSHMNGQIDNGVEFNGEQQTFPKLLQAAGYETAIIGKWHLRSDPTGFDYWNILPGQGAYYNPDFIEMGERSRHEGYVTTITTDFALEWLSEGRDSDKPFCLLLHHKAPHRTWQPDTSLLDDFSHKVFPVPENFFDNYNGRVAAAQQKLSIRTADMDLVYDLKMADKGGVIKSRFGNFDHTARMNAEQKEVWDKHYQAVAEEFLEVNPEGDELDLWKYQRYMRDYLACIESVDQNIGRVLNWLDSTGLSENTIVIYTSDQGFYLGEHGWFDKRFMYEESMRTPLLMRLPDSYETRSVVTDLVQNIDYAPTILDLAGIPVPEDMQGLSLLDVIRTGSDIEFRDALYYHYYEFPNEHMVKRHYGIRTNRYKLIHFYYDIDQWELYDLEKDPSEMNNIYYDSSYMEIKDQLHQRLKELRFQYEVPEDNFDLKNR